MIDLRSDTITLPSTDMKTCMLKAPIGDDVFNEDPSINALEKMAADLFGMEAALFVPSGTMSNQIALKVHTRSGEDIICDYFSHIYQYEGGGIGMNTGCNVSLIQSPKGQFSAQEVKNRIHGDDIHKPISRLVSVENTCNKGGGTTWDLEDLAAIKSVCKTHGLAFHLDGARLFNAMIARKQKPKEYGHLFDTISICLSKGLGAPVGSILLGSEAHIHWARRYRKSMGGGMRQAGSLAAAGIYALENNIERLALDHQRAKEIEYTLHKLSWVAHVVPVETNIVLFTPIDEISDTEVISKLESRAIRASSMGNKTVRLVTHLDFSESMMVQLLRTLGTLF